MATVRLQLRRGLADDWFDANPTLAAGEIGIETDTNTFKFGDGNTPWNSLEYALSGTVDDYIPLNTKAQAGGVASLDSSGFVPVSQLPPLAKVTVSAVADQSARLALTAEAGDIAIQADNGQSYVLSASPASTDANWKALVGSEAVVDTVEAALVAGTGLDKTYNDASGTITIDIDSTVATKTYADQAEADAITAAAADATTKANAAASAAASALSSHESDTTGIHGIADTSLLATTTGTQTLTNKTLTSPVINTPTGITKSDVGLANVDNTSDANKPVSTATASAIATAKSQAQGYADEQINLLIGTAPAALNTLNELADALGDDANYAATVTTSLGLKAPLASPTFTGNVTLPESTSIGNVSNVEIGFLTNVTSDIQGQIDAKLASATAATTYAPLASPTLTGTVTLPESTSIGNVSNLEIGYLNNVTSSIQGQIDEKLASATAATTYAPLASPTLTGTVTLPESTSIGNVSNLEIGYLNNVTSSIQGQIDDKLAITTAASTYAPLAAPTFTGNVTLPESTTIGNVSNLELGYVNGVTSGIQTQLDAKAPLNSPTFTGTVTLPANTISQSMMGDDSVGTNEIGGFAVTEAKLAVNSVTESKIADGAVTSAKIATGTIVNEDINASAAIATSKISGLDTALGLKAPLDSPTFTGTVSGITKTMVGLGSVDDTADTAKPVSTAQASAIATAKAEAIADATSQVNALLTGAPAALNTLDELAAALGDDANFASTVTTNLGLKAPLASPTFTGTVTVAAAGVAFTDGTQTKAGVPSLTTIGTEISAAYNLSTGGLALRDQLIPIAGTRAITVPTNATTAFPIGTSIDFYQASGTGANFVAADVTVTILRTPGLTLRTTYSSATLTKVATNTWLLAGDLTA
jgi:hypothetical protein